MDMHISLTHSVPRAMANTVYSPQNTRVVYFDTLCAISQPMLWYGHHNCMQLFPLPIAAVLLCASPSVG